MDTEELEQTPEAPARKKKQKKPRSRRARLLRRFVALLASTALILGAVFLVVNRDKLNGDALRRLFSYGSVSTGENGQADAFAYSGDSTGCFGTLDGGLLVCSDGAVQLYQKNGESVLNMAVSMEQPVLCTQGDYAVVYDAGGTTLQLIHAQELVRTYSPENGRKLLSARVSEKGWLTIVEEATGYKASVTVYDADFQPVVTENISSSFLMDAVLSPDHKTLAVVSIGEDSSGFDSVVIYYNVSDGQERYRCTLGSDVVLDLDWESGGLWCTGESGAYYIQDGTVAAQYTDNTRFLQNFSLGGDGYAALFFSKYQGGSAGSLTILTDAGTEYSVGVNEDVLSVSAAGDYIAVLTGNEVTVYAAADLTVYATGENTTGARRVLMREDGTAMLIATGSASLFVPD